MTSSCANPRETTLEPNPMAPRKPSIARKLVHAAMLAVLLVLLGSVAAEATPISVSILYQGNGGDSEFGTAKFGSGGTAYSFDLTFRESNGPFEVIVTAIEGPDLTGRLDNFPGHICVPINGTTCVEFQVSAPDPGANTWTGFFDIMIRWNFPTDSTYPNDPVDGNGLGRIRILHNRGDVTGDDFDTDVTTPNTYCPNCGTDAGIGGNDDNFQSFIVTQAPVPEPATLVLLGSGLSALLYRQRRRRN